MFRRILQPGVLLLITTVISSGCCPARLHHLPDDCVDLINQCEVGRAVHNICSDTPCRSCLARPSCAAPVACGCGVAVYEDVVVLDETQPPCFANRLPRVERGPPPVCFEPEMPPKFLPVPTRSVFSPVNLHTRVSSRGAVEAQYGPQLLVPAP